MSSMDRLTEDSTWEETLEKLYELPSFIRYLGDTSQREWLQDRVRNADNSQNCLMGHLINWAYGKDYKGKIWIWDAFEECIATTYMIYPVNDGENPNYPQDTAKERCIAYLLNIVSGKEKTTNQLIEEERKLYAE